MTLCLILAVLSIAWSGILLFDIIVFVLTVYKAAKVGYKVPLIQIVIRDGTCQDMITCAVDDWLHPQDHCTSCKL